MLDPREVRAGNWVIKITGTDTGKRSFFEYKAIGLDEYYYTFARACFPIELSPLILENCGFNNVSGDWQINNGGEEEEERPAFLQYKAREKCWYLRGMKIWSQPAYLHQLQNIYYALLNKELNIRLGKFENIPMMGPIDFFIKPLRKYAHTRELL